MKKDPREAKVRAAFRKAGGVLRTTQALRADVTHGLFDCKR